MKLLFASLLLGSILLVSGIALPAAAAVPSGGTTGTTLSAAPPTYVGPAGGLGTGPLSGPIRATPSTVTTALALTISSSAQSIPSPNPKPITAMGDPPTIPPTVSCQPAGPGCDSITLNSGGANSNPYALNAVDSGSLYGYDIEPPDQTLCAGNGLVMEVLNIGEMQVYGSNLQPVSKVVSLDSLMGLTSLGWGSGGDISCLYDYSNGGHWFITEIVSSTPEPQSPFVGCFAAILDTCREGIAVSVTNNPTGAYNVYFVDPNKVNTDPGTGYLLNDFAKIATTNDAFLMFYDEFNLNPSTYPACPAFGCGGFNGAQEFAFSKSALELGLPAASVNLAYENMGTAPNLYPIPANGQFQTAPATCSSGKYAGLVCWYQVIPAQSPDPSQYDNGNGGTGYMVASLDFFGAGDNRVAAFDWTGLSGLGSHDCNGCRGIEFGGAILTGQVTYMDEGQSCPASQGGFCGLAAQKAGPVPLGDNCYLIQGQATSPCPESGIATNGDGATQASYAQGQLWVAVSTLVNQTFNHAPSEIHVGATYWVIGTSSQVGPNAFGFREGQFTLTGQGYVSASHEDIEFPSIAASDGGGGFGAYQGGEIAALMAFTLSGNGGPSSADGGGFFPSTAYGLLSSSSGGLSGRTIYVADLGKSPQDGFSEYMGYPPTANTRPRWGDYSWAIFVPAVQGSQGDSASAGRGQGGTFLFATEYIQYPNCNDKAFLSDPTCGGTRDQNANWGSSINSLSAAPGFRPGPDLGAAASAASSIAGSMVLVPDLRMAA